MPTSFHGAAEENRDGYVDDDASTPWDPAIAILGGAGGLSCVLASTACLEGSDEDAVSGTEIASHMNNDTVAAKQVIILVDSYDAASFGKFSIRADLN